MRNFLTIIGIFVCCGSLCAAQETANPGPENPEQELARVSRELKETQAQLQESRRQIEELRQGLEILRGQVQGNAASIQPAPAAEPAAAQPASAEPTVGSADQDPCFVSAKIAELHQAQIESQS